MDFEWSAVIDRDDLRSPGRTGRTGGRSSAHRRPDLGAAADGGAHGPAQGPFPVGGAGSFETTRLVRQCLIDAYTRLVPIRREATKTRLVPIRREATKARHGGPPPAAAASRHGGEHG